MGIFDKRRAAQNLVAQRHELTRQSAALLNVLSQPFAGTQSRVVSGFGPKGGGNKTTAMAGISTAMVDYVSRLTVVADFNPDKGTITGRLLGQPGEHTRRLVDLAKEYPNIVKPSDIGPFLDAVGRLHIAHNSRVSPQRVDEITRSQYAGILGVLREQAQLVFVDTGTSLVHSSMAATLAETDHLVIGCLATTDALELLYEGLRDLKDMGHGRLVELSTVVVGVSNPELSLAEVDRYLDWYRGTCAHVEVIPYDPALLTGGLMSWEHLALTTRIGFTRAAVQVAEALHAGGEVVSLPAWGTSS